MKVTWGDGVKGIWGSSRKKERKERRKEREGRKVISGNDCEEYKMEQT
jgi:hypothetical protein